MTNPSRGGRGGRGGRTNSTRGRSLRASTRAAASGGGERKRGRSSSISSSGNATRGRSTSNSRAAGATAALADRKKKPRGVTVVSVSPSSESTRTGTAEAEAGGEGGVRDRSSSSSLAAKENRGSAVSNVEFAPPSEDKRNAAVKSSIGDGNGSDGPRRKQTLPSSPQQQQRQQQQQQEPVPQQGRPELIRRSFGYGTDHFNFIRFNFIRRLAASDPSTTGDNTPRTRNTTIATDSSANTANAHHREDDDDDDDSAIARWSSNQAHPSNLCDFSIVVSVEQDSGQWRLGKGGRDGSVLATPTPNARYVKSRTVYHVHKLIMALGPRRSRYIANLLARSDSGGGTSSSASSAQSSFEVTFPRSACEAFPIMLDYIYYPELSTELTSQTAVALRYLAQFFGVKRLYDEITAFIREDLASSSDAAAGAAAEPSVAESYLIGAAEYGDGALIVAALGAGAGTGLGGGGDGGGFGMVGDNFDVRLVRHLDLDSFRTYVVAPDDTPEGGGGGGFTCSDETMSRIVAEFCRTHEDDVDGTVLAELTDVRRMSVVHRDVAMYLLSLDVKHGGRGGVGAGSGGVEGESPEVGPSLRQRCVNAIAADWKEALVMPLLKLDGENDGQEGADGPEHRHMLPPDLRASLLEAALCRAHAESEEIAPEKEREIASSRELLAEKDREIASSEEILAAKDREIASLHDKIRGMTRAGRTSSGSVGTAGGATGTSSTIPQFRDCELNFDGE